MGTLFVWSAEFAMDDKLDNLPTLDNGAWLRLSCGMLLLLSSTGKVSVTVGQWTTTCQALPRIARVHSCSKHRAELADSISQKKLALVHTGSLETLTYILVIVTNPRHTLICKVYNICQCIDMIIGVDVCNCI